MDRVPAIIPFVFCLALVGCSAEKEQQPAYVPVHEQGVTAAPSAGSAAREMTSDRVARRPEIRGPGIQSSTSPNAELPLWPAPAAPAPSTEQISPPNLLPPASGPGSPPWAALPASDKNAAPPAPSAMDAPAAIGPLVDDVNPLRAADAPQLNPLRSDSALSPLPETTFPQAVPSPSLPAIESITKLPQLPKPGSEGHREAASVPGVSPPAEPLLPHAPSSEPQSTPPPRIPQEAPLARASPARLPRVSIYASPKTAAEEQHRSRSALAPAAPAPSIPASEAYEPSGGAAPSSEILTAPQHESPPVPSPPPALPAAAATPPAELSSAEPPSAETQPAPSPPMPLLPESAPLLPESAPSSPFAPTIHPAESSAEPEVTAIPAVEATTEDSAVIPAAATDEPFDVVRVFYGTDRRPILLNEDTLVSRLLRFLPSAALIALSAVGVGVVLVSRKITWTIGTTALVVLSTLSTWHGISETISIAEQARLEEPKYSTDRSDRGHIDRGICEVSIPKSHDPGELEGPSVIRLETRFDPAKHITLRKTTRLQDSAFYEQLRQQVASSPDREILVFIHGFNVSFDDAARRTAQMAHDLKLKGAPVFFSWPADRGFLLTYGKDEASVSWSAPHLKDFLLDLVHETDAKAINLVAHSMGNRALSTALREIDLQLRDEARLFNQVVLAAPDIDADDFRDNIAPAIQRTAKQVTLYASSNDIALSASRILHRNPRAGDTSQGLVVVPGIVTIDVSNIDGGPWGHSYYGASDPVLRDLHLLLTSLPPERRTWLKMNQLDGQTYWAFKPLGTARSPALLDPR